MSENILSIFKKDLGYVNATNQYVELSIRITEKEHGTDLKNNLQNLAESVNLHLSTLADRASRTGCAGGCLLSETQAQRSLKAYIIPQ